MLNITALTDTVTIPIAAIAAKTVATTDFVTTNSGVAGIAYSPLSGIVESKIV